MTTSTPEAPHLAAQDLGGGRGGRLVFAGVNLRLDRGAAILLRGANGAGKTTLLRTLAGLSPPPAGRLDPPCDGRAVFVGHENAAKPALSARDNLQFWAAIYGAQAAAVTRAAEQLDLGRLLERAAGALSAGQKRRLGLARALLARRPVWLLDEPTASMDARSRATVCALIDAHCAEGGAALVATHDPLPLRGAVAFTMAAA